MKVNMHHGLFRSCSAGRYEIHTVRLQSFLDRPPDPHTSDSQNAREMFVKRPEMRNVPPRNN
jgi:hypothetical protein